MHKEMRKMMFGYKIKAMHKGCVIKMMFEYKMKAIRVRKLCIRKCVR